MKIEENKKGILFTAFNEGFDSKAAAIDRIKLIQYALDTINEDNNVHNRITDQDFVYYLEKGVPHVMGSWTKSNRTRNQIKNYQTNIYCFNLDDLSVIPPKHLPNLISTLLNGPFRFVQESFCSGQALADKKYHLYLPVTHLECIDFDMQQLIYEMVREDLEKKLGVHLDENTYIHKNILGSNHKVHINKDAPVLDLKPYINKIRRIEGVLKKQTTSTSREELIQEIKNQKYVKEKLVTTVDYSKLLKAFKTEGFANKLTYKERGYLYMVLNNMADQGQINEQQKYSLAEVINNG